MEKSIIKEIIFLWHNLEWKKISRRRRGEREGMKEGRRVSPNAKEKGVSLWLAGVRHYGASTEVSVWRPKAENMENITLNKRMTKNFPEKLKREVRFKSKKSKYKQIHIQWI